MARPWDAMTPAPGRYADLRSRILSAAVMAAVGIAAVWAGGLWFLGLVALVVGLMLWELHGLAFVPPDPRAAAALGGLGAAAVAAACLLPAVYALPLALLPAVAGPLGGGRGGHVFAPVAALVVLAGFALVQLRADLGAVWLLWLVLVVIATDVLGYFAGRGLGGPKLWPQVSPGKTWSGTVAGWAGAAAVGAGFMAATGAGAELLALSVAASMAAQAGDIAESAVKRRAGVKDASALIPGHGGLFDRFDGMFGAALFFLIAERLVGFPPQGAAAGG